MLTLLMTAADAPVLYLPLDDEPRARSFRLRTARETFRLIGLIISVGLEHAPRRTIILIGRMALMMLMMVAMGIMMMWMMGMLPECCPAYEIRLFAEDFSRLLKTFENQNQRQAR